MRQGAFVHLRLLSAIGAMTILAAPVRAEELDEAQFLERLAQRDPRLQRLAADVELARAEVVAAGVRENPTAALDREEVFPDGGVATNYARLTVPFDVSGRRGKRIAAARTAVAAASAEAEQTRVELTVAGLRVFYGAAYARLHVDALRAEREALVRAVDIVRKRAGAGASSGYDLQRLELALLAYDDLLGAAEIDLLVARAELGALLGDPAAAIDARSELSLPAHPTAAANTAGERADLRAARLRARAADELAAEAARAWVPSLDVSAGVMSQDTGSDTAFGYTVGLGISLPLFDRGQATIARARGLRRAADADARAIEARTPALVRARRDALDRRIAQAESLASTQLVRLDALLRAAETGYREGENGVVELLDAHQTARDLRLRHLELRRDARLAELDLWLALGRRP